MLGSSGAKIPLDMRRRRCTVALGVVPSYEPCTVATEVVVLAKITRKSLVSRANHRPGIALLANDSQSSRAGHVTVPSVQLTHVHAARGPESTCHAMASPCCIRMGESGGFHLSKQPSTWSSRSLCPSWAPRSYTHHSRFSAVCFIVQSQVSPAQSSQRPPSGTNSTTTLSAAESTFGRSRVSMNNMAQSCASTLTNCTSSTLTSGMVSKPGANTTSWTCANRASPSSHVHSKHQQQQEGQVGVANQRHGNSGIHTRSCAACFASSSEGCPQPILLHAECAQAAAFC
jgi:hypothetical protein